MSCINKITGGISYNKSQKPVAGIECKAILVNRDSIDQASLAYDATTGVLTNLSLKSGEVAYNVDNLKQLNVAGSEFTASDSGINTHSNSFLGRIYNLDATGVKFVEELGDASLVLVVERKAKGDGTSAFIVLGLENGMVQTEGTYSSAENNGMYVFTIASEEGFGESKPITIWNETDYATTKAKFDNLLAVPAV